MRSLIAVASPILDILHDGVVIVDAQGIVCYVNEANRRITGLSKKQVINKHVSSVVPLSSLLKVLEKKEALTNVKTIVNKKTVISNIIPVKKGKNVIGAISIFRDITEIQELTKQLEFAKETIRHFESDHAELIIGKNKRSQQAFELARKAAAVPSTVLLIGESGTGKEMMAKYIHEQSDRKDGPFVPVNCTAIPEHLLESELFGYEEGAFTGSKKGGKKGLFELANKGTIFLDEIADMPLHLQVKLLRVIQERKITRVGSLKEKKVDIKIIAATHQDFEEKIQKKEFRKDLYFRLAVFPINLPRLNDTPEDIPIFISFFLTKICKKLNKPIVTITNKALHILESRSYSGNIRELENILERTIILDEDGVIDEDDLSILPSNNKNEKIFKLSLEEGIFPLEEVEKRYLQKITEIYPSKSDLMKELKISRATLYRKIKKIHE